MPVTKLSLQPLGFVVFAGSLALGYYTPRRLRFIYALAQLATIVAINLLVPLEVYRDYAFNILGWGWMYRAVEFFIVSDPYEEYYWVGDRKKDDDAELTNTRTCRRGAGGSGSGGNLFSLRGAGWSWAIDQMQQGDPAGTPRRVFVWHKLQYFAAMYSGVRKYRRVRASSDVGCTVLAKVTVV
ncbi:hypothetical protein EWM64_g5470 [Hericium alpestre]|uniref:Uncharacterized protein n=1 Tax=Hericium alpestre TaxID=135208 RepID=A0A4Y9ZYH3_9AGAM|nr:hypothetical protein EWM64_g5470 [Hericium alpestre]